MSATTVGDAAAARIVVVAVPWAAFRTPSRDSTGNDQIVIDATNDFDPSDLHDRTSSEVVTDLVDGAHVVKAANTLAAAVLGGRSPRGGLPPCALALRR